MTVATPLRLDRALSNDSSTLAQATLDPKGSFVTWSQGMQELSGLPPDEGKGSLLSSILAPLCPRQFPPLDACAVSWTGTVAVASRGKGVPRIALAHLHSNADAKTITLVIEDLPQHPASHADPTALHAHIDRQRFALFVDYLPAFMYTADRNLTFTSSVGAGLAKLSLAPGQVVGMSLLDIWGVRDPNYEPLACHLRVLAGSEHETYLDVCNGRSIHYHLRPLRDIDGEIIGVVSSGLDVTEHAHAMEERDKLTMQLRQAQKMEAIGRLAGGVAHDFNNLLTCIIGNLSLALMEADPNSPLSTYLDGASAAADSAAQLTRQLMAFGRKQVIQPRAINLSKLVERMQGMLQRLIGESITLSVNCAKDLGLVHADPGQLEQVLVNLVVNARDAITGYGHIWVETHNIDNNGDDPTAPLVRGVLLTVRDSGRGMSDVVRAHLFEPFFTTKDVGAGTGLGLATVYGTVQQNGGTIAVDSALGKGATFRIYLPRLEGQHTEQTHEATSDHLMRPQGGTETVLLVEDEPLLLDLANCSLQQLGYNVIPCATADEGLRQVREHQSAIDLLLTDVVMPRMNGKELAARVTAIQPGVAVLFSSGYGEDIITKQGVLDEGLNFIGKPYRPLELAIKVRAVLDAKNKKRAKD
jgi:signal transduction histidine kinase/ActR/RegA family two-component response regulator